jgi:hypothetical protein
MKTINSLKIHPSVFTTRFPRQCTVPRCSSECCEGGVWVDSSVRDKILANKELFKKYMKKEFHDESKWFDEEEDDGEFPSGKCFGINDEARKFCIFFEKEHGCVLQKAAKDTGKHEWAYKSFFCILFPLTIVNGVFMVDDDIEEFHCGLPENQKIPIWQACRREIEYLLGKDFYAQLEEMSRDFK